MEDMGIEFCMQWPDKNTVIRTRYSISDPWFVATTCKRGCCVYGPLGHMTTPTWWKPAEPGDIETLQHESKIMNEAIYTLIHDSEPLTRKVP
jgi:hypothetical protein